MSALHIAGSMTVGRFHLQLDFEAPAGVTVLFGPSASGKSLTLRAVAGHERLDSGVMALGERVLSRPPEAQVPPHLRPLGYAPQEAALWPHRRVRQHVEPFASRARADDLADRLGLRSVWERRPHDLSGGERQRVALARALAREPALLLLDEPFTALDQPTRIALGRVVRDEVRRTGAVALLVTHDPLEARRLADHLVIFEAGQGGFVGRGAPRTALEAIILPPPVE